MNSQLVRQLAIVGVMALLGLGFGPLQPAIAEGGAVAVEKEMDVLAYGPIHEGFAKAVALNPEPGMVVPKAPPDAIKEIPPEQKPEGNVVWIPGYWAWDDDRNDFIWVSGIWRVAPPDRQWVPGYWVKCDSGFQWISGYWAPVVRANATYLPPPPESLEAGPNVRAPSPDYVWIPGCWIWQYGRYVWRPGCWVLARPEWIWVPAHYVWTPVGYVFVAGYWDVAIAHRGVLFAPVFFGISVRVAHGFCFSPSFRIDLRVFSDCLFLRPRYHHYYFGDFYAPMYSRRGIFPWFSPHVRRHIYDPIYRHQRWKHRHDIDWEKKLHASYQERRDHTGVGSRRTLLEPGKSPPTVLAARPLGRSLKTPVVPATKRIEGPLPSRGLNKRNERPAYEERRKQVRRPGNERVLWDSRRSDRSLPEVSKGIRTNRPTMGGSRTAAGTGMGPAAKNGSANRFQPSPSQPMARPLHKKFSQGAGNSRSAAINGHAAPRSHSPGLSPDQTPAIMARDLSPASRPRPTPGPAHPRSFMGGDKGNVGRFKDRAGRR